MMHRDRRWSVTEVDTVEELAEQLTQHSHCGCAGFSLKGFLFLNDSISEDGAQEYAVLDPTLQQVETVTFGWMSRAEAELFLNRLLAGEEGRERMGQVAPDRLETPEKHGKCFLCA